MEIVYTGTPDYVIAPLDAILNSNHTVSLVVTPPDRASGRGRSREAPPLKKAALERGLHVYQPESINDDVAIERLSQEDADLMIVASFGKILSEEARNVTANPAINIHPSLLPRYRGPAPVARAILNGEKTTGVSFFQLTENVDAGPIISQFRTEIDPDETTGELRQRLFERAAEQLPALLDQYQQQEIELTPQDDSKATHAPFLRKEEARISWNKSAERIRNHVRAMQPWPTSFSWLDIADRNEPLRLKIFQGDVKKTQHSEAAPGTITQVDSNGLQVQTGEESFVVTELQPPNKQRMKIADFVNGYQPNTGDRFTNDAEAN